MGDPFYALLFGAESVTWALPTNLVGYWTPTAPDWRMWKEPTEGAS